MATYLNHYQCRECGHKWKLVASNRTRDRCEECATLAHAGASRMISRLLYTWRCPPCGRQWEGDPGSCHCGTPHSLIQLVGMSLDSEQGRFRLLEDPCHALSRPDDRDGPC